VGNAEPQFVRFDDVRAFELAAGVSGRPLFGAGAMINLIEFEPGAVVPLHSHPHEQISYILEGAVRFQVGDVGYDLKPGEGLVIPGGVTHGAVQVGPEGCRMVEIFTPLRDDYVALMRQAGQE